MSETSAALIRGSLPSGVSLRDLGLHRLKDLGRPQQIFQLQATGLGVDFPPLRSLDNAAFAHNLPAHSSTFIGREQELEDVRALVARSRLAATDSVALFIERAYAQGVELVLDRRTGPLVASICRRLDGMPLAIELAAARLRSLPVSTLHGLLDQRFRLLTEGSRSALERQQTLRATVDWSYSLLTDSERGLLRRLSAFVGEFDLEGAVAVYAFDGIEEFDVTDTLGSLVDKSLVVAESDGSTIRYRLLETIRQFASGATDRA